MVVSEILARESAIHSSRLVEHGDVRVNPVLVDKPAEHLGRAIAAIAKQATWVQVKALDRPLNHSFCSHNLSLPDGCCRLDIDNDRVLDIDQIIRMLIVGYCYGIRSERRL